MGRSLDLLHDKPETYRYMQCHQCRLIYQDPMPPPAEIAVFYPWGFHVPRCHQLRTELLP